MAQSKALIHEVDAEKFVNSLASKLQEVPEFTQPEWSYYVKTSAAKARPPFSGNWWQMRAASILRKIYAKGTLGVEHLRKAYTSKKNMGHKPGRVYRAGGKVIRTILQQAEKAGFLEKRKEGRLGRQLTKKGLEFMNNVISEVKASGK